MNAQAHLISLGWAGPGHSLDSRPDSLPAYKQKGHRGLAYDPARDPAKVGNTGTGLVKPLSISQRKARFGIGKKAHEPASGTDWWLKGFENALGNIGKSESERSSGVSTPIGNAEIRFSNGGGKHGGLYRFFIRGQLMEGTMKEIDQSPRSKKRKSDALDDEKGDSEEQSSSASAAHITKADKMAGKDFETMASFVTKSQKDVKRRMRKEREGDVEQFTQVGAFFEARDGVDKKRRKQKPDSIHNIEEELQDNNSNGDAVARIETKGERRERRRKKKEAKALKTKLEATTNASNGIPQQHPSNKSDTSTSTEKAARKAERKRRKAEREKTTSV